MKEETTTTGTTEKMECPECGWKYSHIETNETLAETGMTYCLEDDEAVCTNCSRTWKKNRIVVS